MSNWAEGEWTHAEMVLAGILSWAAYDCHVSEWDIDALVTGEHGEYKPNLNNPSDVVMLAMARIILSKPDRFLSREEWDAVIAPRRAAAEHWLKTRNKNDPWPK